jgi:AraC-like DNA-binding protein
MSGDLAVTHGAEFFHVAFVRRATTAHALPLHKLVVPLDGAAVRCEHAGRHVVSRRPLLVAASELQTMASSGPSLAVFVSPFGAGNVSGRMGPGLRQLAGPDADCAVQLARALMAQPVGSVLIDVTAELRARFLVQTPIDRRVARMLEQLPPPGSGSRPSVTRLASALRMSRFRLSHLFAEAAGVSLRSWLSYRRALAAVHVMATGKSGACAAMECGYADQAQLCRDLRQHFGRRPAEIRSTNVQAA